jgi:hypothetical protein
LAVTTFIILNVRECASWQRRFDPEGQNDEQFGSKIFTSLDLQKTKFTISMIRNEIGLSEGSTACQIFSVMGKSMCRDLGSVLLYVASFVRGEF